MLQQFLHNPAAFQCFHQKFNEFARQFNPNADPRQIVQNLLNTGKMTQEQFNRFRNIANHLTGMRL